MLDTLSFFVVVNATLYHVRAVVTVSVQSLGRFNPQFDALSPLLEHVQVVEAYDEVPHEVPLFSLLDLL